MRLIITLICLVSLFGCIQKLYPQKNNQIWSHKIFDYAITFNFEQELFKVDTINSYEGYVFYFKSLNDSSYFRMNYITPHAKFECCKDDSIFKEINRTYNQLIIDRNGKIKSSNLYWREIKNSDIEIVYNNCSEEKLKFFNKVMDSISYKLVHKRRKATKK